MAELDWKQKRNEIQQKIRAGLEGKSREVCCAFAARAALRLMPYMALAQCKAGKRGEALPPAFGFWSAKNRKTHLLGQMRGVSAAILRALDAATSREVLSESRKAASASAASVAAAAASVAAAAAYAAYAAAADAYAADADAAAYAADAADAADAAAYAAAYAYAYADIILLLEQQINIELKSTNTNSAEDLLKTPIWSALQEPGAAANQAIQTAHAYWQELYTCLQQQMLRLDPGFAPWCAWLDARIQSKPISAAEQLIWIDYPAEKAAQGPTALYAYLQNRINQTAILALKRVRAIFIGNGDAGKTSLINALHGQDVVAGRGDMTPGIEICEWDGVGDDIITHLWDFGGQVMAHASHQFFLRANCVYVIVIEARAEIQANEQMQYWLEHVRAYGRSAPVFLVGNKHDVSPVNLGMDSLTQQYPNILGFYPVACTQAKVGEHKDKFNSFRTDFCRQLQSMAKRNPVFTEAEFSILQAVRDLAQKQAFLKQDDFQRLCEEQKLAADAREIFLQFLDNLGLIVHFAQNEFLDEFILDPRWLTHGVYALMYGKQARLSNAQVRHCLQHTRGMQGFDPKHQYDANKCHTVITAMAEFKLCYWLESSKEWIIPVLLDANPPPALAHTGFNKQTALAYKLAFKNFVPRHLMPQMIVRRNQEIVDELVWQNGVLLQSKLSSARAWLEVDYQQREFYIWVQGAVSDGVQEGAFAYLRSFISDLLLSLGENDFEREEFLRLPASALDAAQAARHAGIDDWAGITQLLTFWDLQLPVFPSSRGLKYRMADVFQVFPVQAQGAGAKLGDVEKHIDPGARALVIIGGNFYAPVTMVESMASSTIGTNVAIPAVISPKPIP